MSVLKDAHISLNQNEYSEIKNNNDKVTQFLSDIGQQVGTRNKPSNPWDLVNDAYKPPR